MQPLRPSTKAGVIAGGLVAAFAAAWVAVDLRQRLTQGPDAQAASGMYAAGDMFLGIGVFGLLALVPLALGLFWLRPVARFWIVLASAAVVYALTGPLGLLVSGWLRDTVGSWALLSDARIALMPLGALAMSMCGLFAPQPRQRWILIVAGLVEGGLFAAVILVKFMRP